jgi:hypothetical protein
VHAGGHGTFQRRLPLPATRHRLENKTPTRRPSSGKSQYRPQSLRLPNGTFLSCPFGIVPVVGTFACESWVLVAEAPFYGPYGVTAQVTLEGESLFPPEDVLKFYLVNPTVSPYFTWGGYLFHVTFGASVTLYICVEDVTWEKTPSGYVVGTGMLDLFPEKPRRGLGQLPAFTPPAAYTAPSFALPPSIPAPALAPPPSLAPPALKSPSGPILTGTSPPVAKGSLAPPAPAPIPSAVIPPGSTAFSPPAVTRTAPVTSPGSTYETTPVSGPAPMPLVAEVALGVLAFGFLGGVVYLVFGDS